MVTTCRRTGQFSQLAPLCGGQELQDSQHRAVARRRSKSEFKGRGWAERSLDRDPAGTREFRAARTPESRKHCRVAQESWRETMTASGDKDRRALARARTNRGPSDSTE